MRYYECPIDVRWGDLDMLGHVNNVAYMSYFEHGRTEMIRSIRDLGWAENIGLVVVQANLSYKASATCPGALKVVTSVQRLGNTSITLHQSLQDREGGETVYCDAEVTLVWVDLAQNKPIPVPAFFREWAEQSPASQQ